MTPGLLPATGLVSSFYVSRASIYAVRTSHRLSGARLKGTNHANTVQANRRRVKRRTKNAA